MKHSTIIRTCKTHGETEYYEYLNSTPVARICKACIREKRLDRYKNPKTSKMDRDYTKQWAKDNPDRVKLGEIRATAKKKANINTRVETFFKENQELIQKSMELLHPRKHAELDLRDFYDKVMGLRKTKASTLEGFLSRIQNKLRTKYHMNISISLKYKYREKGLTYADASEEIKEKVRSEAKQISSDKCETAIRNLILSLK